MSQIRKIAKLTTCLFSCFLAACTVGDVMNPGPDPTPDPVGDPDPVGEPDPNGSIEIAGSIATSAAWGGEVRMSDEAIIEAGVTVVIGAGTRFEGAQGAVLRVHGTLRIEGTVAAPVTMNPVEGAGGWGGIVVEDGGSVTLANATGAKAATLLYCKVGAVLCHLEGLRFESIGKAVQADAVVTVDKSSFREMSNGGVAVSSTGDLTITDSYIWTSTHDIVVQSGGSLFIDQSEVGGATMSYEHCDIHVGSADSFTLTNSNVVSAIYGMMLGGTQNAIIQYNNFVDNDLDQDVSPVGTNTSVDLRYNYWSNGAPDLGAEYDVSMPAAARITSAGPTWQLP